MISTVQNVHSFKISLSKIFHQAFEKKSGKIKVKESDL